MAVDVGALEATLGINVQKFKAGLNDAGTKLKTFGTKVSSAGKSLSLGLTAPITGAAVLAVRAASDFESSFAGVIKTVDATEDELAEFERALKELALEIPIDVNELNSIAEAAGQLGISNEGLIAFAETMALVGVATNLASDEAAIAFARFSNITGLPEDRIADLASVMVELGNTTATTESEILNFATRIAGASDTVGLTEDQIFGFSATMAAVGLNAEAGGTAFNRTIGTMAKAVFAGGEEVERFADIAGVSSSDFTTAFKDDPASAIQTFLGGLKGMKDGGEDVFTALDDLGLGSQRTIAALLQMAGGSEALSANLNTAAEEFENADALANEAAKRFETFDSKVQLLKNTFNDLAISFGEIIIPVLLQLFEVIKPIIEGFKNLPAPTKKIILIMGFLLAALGPVLIVVGALISAVGTIAVAFGAITLPVLLVIAGIAAIIAIGILLIKNWGKIKKNNKELFDAISGAWKDLVGAVKPAAQAMFKAIGKGLEALRKVWKKVWPVISRVLRVAVKIIGKVIKTKLLLAMSSIKIAAQVLSGDWKGAWESMKERARAVIDGIAGVIAPLKDLMLDVLDRSKELITAKVIEWKTAFVDWFDDMKTTLPIKMEEWAAAIKTWFESMPERITTQLGAWATAITTWWDTTKPKIVSKLGDWWTAIKEWFASIPSRITEQLVAWGQAIVTWFQERPAEIAASLATWWSVIKTWFIDRPVAIVSALVGWGIAILGWYDTTRENIKTKLGEWWTAWLTWLISIPALIVEQLGAWWAGIGVWFDETKENILLKLGGWWDSIKGWFDGRPEKIVTLLEKWTAAMNGWSLSQGKKFVKWLGDWWTKIKNWITSRPAKWTKNLTTWGTAIREWFEKTRDKILPRLADWWDKIKNWFAARIEGIKTGLSGWGTAIRVWFSETGEKIGTRLGKWKDKIGTFLSELPTFFTDKLKAVWEAIKEWLESITTAEEVKATGKKMVRNIVTGAEDEKQNMLDRLGKLMLGIILGIPAFLLVALVSLGVEIVDQIAAGVRSAQGALKQAVIDAITFAYNAIKNMIVPKIPLPHLTITGGFDLDPFDGNGISVPSFGVEWFGEGGIVTTPSIVGVGERGPEAIIPLNQLDKLGGGNTFNVTINAGPGANGRKIAGDFVTEMERQLSNANIRRGL